MQTKFQDEIKEARRIRYWERIMKTIPAYGNKTKPRSCKDCHYYQPDWEYRKCYYVECPYQKNRYTIRSTPLAAGQKEMVEDVEGCC